MVERTPTVSKPLLFPQTNITARDILLYYRFVEANTSYHWNKGAPFVCECFCVCVFGYKERVMCGLWAVMEDPVSLMWWTLYSLYTINGTHSSTELSSVRPVFMSCRWRYKKRGKKHLVKGLSSIRCIISETFSAGPRMKADWWKRENA